MAETTNSLRLVGVLSDIDPFTVTKVKKRPTTAIRKGESQANVLSDFYYFLVGEREDKKKTDKKTAIAEKQIAIEGGATLLADTTVTVVKEQSTDSDSGVLAMLGIVSVGAGLFVFSDDIQKKINELKEYFDESKSKDVVDKIKKLFDFDNIMSGMGIPSGGDISLSKEAIDPKEVYKYLTETKGIDPVHAMGMMANIMGESGFKPGAFVTDEKGLPTGGLFQHHDPVKGKGRFTEMTKFVGADWQKDWKKQIDFALSESETKQYLATPYATSVQATGGFTHIFEKPKNEQQDIAKRTGFIAGIQKRISETPRIQSGQLYYPAPRESMNRIVGHVHEQRPGHEHKGVDYAMVEGTQISAANSGIVHTGFQKGGAGKYITITGDDGSVTKYFHLKQISVQEGQRVSAGELIGLSGGKAGADYSGSSEGPHLHFEYWKNGILQDPEKMSFVGKDGMNTPAQITSQPIPRKEVVSSINPPPTIVVQQTQAYVEQKKIVKQLSTSESDNPPHRSA